MVIKDAAWEKQQWQVKDKWQQDNMWEESKTGWEKFGYTTQGKGQGKQGQKKKEGQWEETSWRERSPWREPEQTSTAQSSNYEAQWQVSTQAQELKMPKPTIGDQPNLSTMYTTPRGSEAGSDEDDPWAREAQIRDLVSKELERTNQRLIDSKLLGMLIKGGDYKLTQLSNNKFKEIIPVRNNATGNSFKAHSAKVQEVQKALTQLLNQEPTPKEMNYAFSLIEQNVEITLAGPAESVEPKIDPNTQEVVGANKLFNKELQPNSKHIFKIMLDGKETPLEEILKTGVNFERVNVDHAKTTTENKEGIEHHTIHVTKEAISWALEDMKAEKLLLLTLQNKRPSPDPDRAPKNRQKTTDGMEVSEVKSGRWPDTPVWPWPKKDTTGQASSSTQNSSSSIPPGQHTQTQKMQNYKPFDRTNKTWTKALDPELDQIHMIYNFSDFLIKETVKLRDKAQNDKKMSETEKQKAMEASNMFEQKAKDMIETAKAQEEQFITKFKEWINFNNTQGWEELSEMSENSDLEESTKDPTNHLTPEAQLDRITKKFGEKKTKHLTNRKTRRQRRKEAQDTKIKEELATQFPKERKITRTEINERASYYTGPLDVLEDLKDISKQYSKERRTPAHQKERTTQEDMSDSEPEQPELEEEQESGEANERALKRAEKDIRTNATIMGKTQVENMQIYVHNKSSTFTSLEEATEKVNKNMEKQTKLTNTVVKLQQELISTRAVLQTTKNELKSVMDWDIDKKATAQGFRMFYASEPGHVANQEIQRDYIIERIMMLTNDTAGQGHHLWEEQITSKRNNGHNEYVHKTAGKRFLERVTHIKFTDGWIRDRLFHYINKKNIYEYGFEEEIHPDLRWDPNDPTSADFNKLGKEFYTYEVRKNKSWEHGPRAGMITFKKVTSQDYKENQQVLKCLQKAYNMHLGDFKTQLDLTNSSLLISDAVADGLSGYLGWVGYCQTTNKASIFWSQNLGGDIHIVKRYFDAYMRLESMNAANDKGKGKGPSKHDIENYMAELKYLNDMSVWFDNQRDEAFSVDQNPDAKELDMKGKGRPPKGMSKGKTMRELLDPWGQPKDEKGKGNEKGKAGLVNIDFTHAKPFPYTFDWYKIEDEPSPLHPHSGEIYQDKKPWFDMHNAWLRLKMKESDYVHQAGFRWQPRKVITGNVS